MKNLVIQDPPRQLNENFHHFYFFLKPPLTQYQKPFESSYFMENLPGFHFWYYGWKSFIYILKIFTILVDLWTKFEKVYKNDLKNIINKMFRIGFHISYLIKIHQKLFCTQNKHIDVVFAGAARRAGPDSMLILCLCVYLR